MNTPKRQLGELVEKQSSGSKVARTIEALLLQFVRDMGALDRFEEDRDLKLCGAVGLVDALICSAYAVSVVKPAVAVLSRLSDERRCIDDLVTAFDRWGVVGADCRSVEGQVAFLEALQRAKKLQLDYPTSGTLDVPFVE